MMPLLLLQLRLAPSGTVTPFGINLPTKSACVACFGKSFRSAARLTRCPGEDEEDTEAFRNRYLDSFSSQSYGGNRRDYKEKVGSLERV